MKKELFLKIVFLLTIIGLNASAIAQIPVNWACDTGIQSFKEDVIVQEGLYSCGVIVNSETQAECDFSNIVEFAVSGGTIFRFSFWYLTSQHVRMSAVVEWSDATTTYSENYGGPSTTEWTEFSFEGAVPVTSTTAKMRLRFYDLPGFAAPETQYVDNVKFENPIGTPINIPNCNFESWPVENIDDILTIHIGWNLISIDVIPNPITPEAVFAPLITASNLEIVTGFQNQMGVFFDPAGLPFLNTLTQLNPGEGYWVKVTTETTLNVSGEAIIPTFAINLKTGWNLLSFWPAGTTTPEAAFANLITAGILQMVTGYEQGGKFYDPNGLQFLNTLTEIKNGFGYWVKVSEDYIGFTYPVTWNCGDFLIDDRNGQSYQSLQIGTQCWMKENLNIGTRIDGISNQTNNGIIEKYCFNNDEANCTNYGGLYQWNEMMQYITTAGVIGICPIGWHVPSDAEWTMLTTYVSSQTSNICNSNVDYIAKSLAATTNWDAYTETCAIGNNLAVNNTTRFTAQPGGYRYTDGTFYSLSNYGNWWSSSQNDASLAWCRGLHYDGAGIYRYGNSKSYGFSVRCLKN